MPTATKPVVTVPVEIAEAEAGTGADIDHVPALSLTHVGLDGPAAVACIAIRWQIAQKLQACTEHPSDRVNDRFRDLLDLQLLGDLVTDDGWPEVRMVCIDIFKTWAKHPWPPQIEMT